MEIQEAECLKSVYSELIDITQFCDSYLKENPLLEDFTADSVGQLLFESAVKFKKISEASIKQNNVQESAIPWFESERAINQLNQFFNRDEQLLSEKEIQGVLWGMVVDGVKNKKEYTFAAFKNIVKSKKKQNIYFYFGLKNVAFRTNEDIPVTSDIRIIQNQNFDTNFQSDTDLRKKYIEDNFYLLEVKVNGGFNKFSQKRAEKIAQRVINLLNFIAGPEHDYISYNGNFSVISKYSRYKDITITRMGKQIGFRAVKFPNLPVTIPVSIDKIKKYSYLLSSHLNQKECQVILAMFWMDRGLKDKNENAGFLEVMIALEAIAETADHNGSSITNQVSLTVAIILSENEKEKAAIKKKVRTLYNYRSRLVHGEPVNDLTGYFNDAYKLIHKTIEKYLFSEKYCNLESINEVWKYIYKNNN